MFLFFFNDTATTEIYTLSLHDALPILMHLSARESVAALRTARETGVDATAEVTPHHLCLTDEAEVRSEEHTSELQSQSNLVCRLLLEKKKNHETNTRRPTYTTNHCYGF